MPSIVSATNRRKPIRLWREEIGMLQRELAEQLGILRSTLSLIESGKRSPTPDQLEMLSAIFGCSIAEIAYRESPTGGMRGRPVGSVSRGKSGASFVIDENGKVWW